MRLRPRHPIRRAVPATLVVLVLAGLFAAGAGARTVPPQQPMRVLIVPRITDAEFARLAQRGAVGLMVPGVGPTTNRRQALAALVRGAVQNARLGGVPSGPTLISADAVTGFPTAHPVIIVVLPPKGAPVLNDRRYPIAVVGRGYHGLLVSRTTRIPGVVSIADIAPTALQRPARDLRYQASPNAAEIVQRLDGRITANNQLKLPALIAIAVLIGFLALLRPGAALPALPAALLGSLGLGFLGPTSIPLLVTVFCIAIVGGGLLLERICSSEQRLLTLFALVLGAYLVALAVDPTSAAINPLGPTQNSRFFGIGNQVETLFLAPVLGGAALAGRRFGIVGFLAVSVFGFVAVAGNGLGADAGGAAVLAVALAVLGSRLGRLRRNGLLLSLGVGAVAVLALFWFDQMQGGSNHMRSAFAHGFGGLVDVMRNRVPLAYSPALHQWQFVGPFFLAFVVASVLTLRGRQTPGRRDLLTAVIVATAVSLLVNDSAAYVLVASVTTLVAVRCSPFRFAPLRPLALRSPATIVAPERLATEPARD
jgi:hypothetical protein